MIRKTLFALACAGGLLGCLHAAAADPAPQRAAAEPGEQTFKSTTLSSEAYEPKTTLEGTPLPNCQIKIGDDWSDTPAATLDDCANLLDQKSPADPKPMTTAYWNNLYLSADDKNIYQASKEETAWAVLRARGKR
ncbi:hypothetical protein [Solimonas terrae]|uniref:Alkaline proteinase inhibitor/ Outer membrane lipoprotein Omp19 domain-containing protein n=1 Tax=Solimonas terrae TaxID=1396819 RepID=A0A6M2BXG4_9GAMM|nr:hypothetical protein [Solimonas terrae]NGY06871.1 hypothetical protein [Solimonas terrae]